MKQKMRLIGMRLIRSLRILLPLTTTIYVVYMEWLMYSSRPSIFITILDVITPVIATYVATFIIALFLTAWLEEILALASYCPKCGSKYPVWVPGDMTICGSCGNRREEMFAYPD